MRRHPASQGHRRNDTTGLFSHEVHADPLAVVEALALPATASGIASAAKPVRASKALRENDMGISNPSADRRLSPASTHLRVHPANRFAAP